MNLAILQARMSSSRLPGKVMLPVNGQPMIFWQLKRIQEVKEISKIVVATSTDESDDVLSDYLEALQVQVFRGSLNDVHSRFLSIIVNNPSYQNIIRLTGDCPLTMPDVLRKAIKEFMSSKVDYLSNGIRPTFPDGLDVEIFSRESFLIMSNNELTTLEKEHVTPGFLTGNLSFKIGHLTNNEDLSQLRWTVDYPQDFNFINGLFGNFSGRELTFTIDDVLSLLEERPDLNTQLSPNFRNIALLEGMDN